MPTRPATVFTASRKSRLEGLRALRDKLSRVIDASESGRDLASLSARHVEVLGLIAELESAEQATQQAVPSTAADEVAERRARRLAERRGA